MEQKEIPAKVNEVPLKGKRSNRKKRKLINKIKVGDPAEAKRSGVGGERESQVQMRHFVVFDKKHKSLKLVLSSCGAERGI